MLTEMNRVASVSAFAIVTSFALAALAREANAAAPPPELMAKLAVHAAGFEAMRTHASYAFDGKLDDLDGDGKTTGKKVLDARVEANGTLARLVVIKYLEDGEDKTEDARKKARDAEEKRKSKTEDEREKEKVPMPFLVSAQSKYTFDEVETDAKDPTRVRIAFVPKAPTEQTIEGSAWVDTKAGTVLSAGFKMSKTPLFIDWIHFTVEFGETTPLGPAISKITTEGRGGILFFHKHFVGSATVSDYRISP
jgi:hypothetical protein